MLGMAKVLKCRELGMNCDFVARGRTEDDVLRQISMHAREKHDMEEIPANIMKKVVESIHEE